MAPVKIQKLIRSRRRTIALEIAPNATLVVRAPLREPLARIEEFVREKAGWISRHLSRVALRPHHCPKEFTEGEKFLYLGQAYVLRLKDNGVAPLLFQDEFVLNRACRPFAKQMFVNWYIKEAKKTIGERARVLARKFGFSYQDVKITAASRRWGSCSVKDELNFTWRLVMAPMAVIDYVVVHELAHTREKNHSRNFWRVVAAMMPDYKTQLKWLRENEKLLEL